MTIVSHEHRFVFIKTRKTAGSSIEASLVEHLGPRDWVSTVREVEPLARRPWLTTNTTTWPIPRERVVKKLIGRSGLMPALALKQHSSAAEVRRILGGRRWDAYTKVAVERDPWDRTLSLWRWRSRSRPCSLDEYLDMIETGDDRGHRQYRPASWSNWPLYAEGDDVIVDQVILYDRVADELLPLLRSLGIEHPGELPRLKSGHRDRGDLADRLTASQVERIARLHRREIDTFGFTAPAARRQP